MIFGKARIGEKVVLFDAGGMWRKVSDTTVEMVIGPRPGETRALEPETEVYVFFERDERKAMAAPVGVQGAMRVVLVDSASEKEMIEIPDASAQQISAYAFAETVRLTPPGRRKPRAYIVDDVVMDQDAQTLYLAVRDVSCAGGEVADVLEP